MMISCVPQYVSSWPSVSSLVRIVGLPPKDPPDDDDENEQDEENDEEGNEDEDQPSSNRTNADAEHSGLWLLEITDYF